MVKVLENGDIEDFIEPVKNQIKELREHLRQMNRRYNRKKYDKLIHKKDFEYSIPTRNSWKERRKIYLGLLDIIEGFIDQLNDVMKSGDSYNVS